MITMKVHTSVNSNRGIVFNVQVNVFLNTESEISSLTEVALLQLVFLDFETTFKNFLSLQH
jgi:hypothetical protein